MQIAPATRVSLLVRIQDPSDTQAWKEFVELYASVVYGFARKRGLQDADAADVMQDVFRSVATAAGKLVYDPAKGTFRGWLYAVTRNKLYTFLDRKRRNVQGTGDTGAHQRLDEFPDSSNENEQWDEEYERRTFAWAAQRVKHEFRDQTWKAFWSTAVDGKDPSIVSKELGMSPGAIYVAKSRVITRIRKEIDQLRETE
jgi:RNA polymerase sigma factor (sigma-70 family)